MLQEFKKFALKGNVLDMAIGIIMGVAFGKIITSFVGDVLMPPIGLMLGQVDFSSLFINLGPAHFATLAEAKDAGAPTINYGLFLNTVLDFLIVAFIMFLMVRQINRMKAPEAPAPVVTKECGFCYSAIPVKATRCPHCTSEQQQALGWLSFQQETARSFDSGRGTFPDGILSFRERNS